MPLAAFAQDEANQTLVERVDRGTIVAFLENNLSGAGREVILRGFEGALSSQATATQLTIADSQGIWLTLNDITLDWSRASLLRGAVSVKALTAGEIIVARAPIPDPDLPTPEARGFALPELPVSINVKKLEATRLVLGESLLGQAFEGSIVASINLDGGDGNTTLQILRTDDGPDGKVDLTAAYSNADQSLALDLRATEGAGGIAATLLALPGAPSVDLTVEGGGPLTDFAATLALQTDGRDRLAGTLTLTGDDVTGATRFDTAITGDLAPLFAPEYGDFFGDSVALTLRGARAETGRLDLTTLSLTAASVNLQGSARIAPDGLPEAFALTGRLADPSGAAVLLPGSDGRVTLQSADIDVGFDAGVDEAWRAMIVGQGLITDQATVAAFDLKGSGRIKRGGNGRLVGGTLTATTQGVALQDAALSQAVGDRQTVQTRFSWTEDMGALRIAPLDVDAGGVTARIIGTLSGLQDAFRLEGNAEVQVPDMARFSAISGLAFSGAGTVRIEGQGSPLAGDFDLKARVQGTDLAMGIAEVDRLLRGTSTVAADVVRDTAGTTIRSFSVDAGTLSAAGKGAVSTATADLDFGFTFADLGVLGPTYGGSATGQARLVGAISDKTARLTTTLDGRNLAVGIPEADRMLAGASSVQLAATLAGGAVQITQLDVSAPALSASIQGRVSPDLSDLTASVDLTDLGLVRPEFGGAVMATAQVSGALTEGRATIIAAIDGTNIALGIPEVNRLLTGASQIRLSADLADNALDVKSLTVNATTLSAEVVGRLAEVGSDITARVSLADLGVLGPRYGGRVVADATLTGPLQDARIGLTAQTSGARIGQREADRLLAGTTDLSAALRYQEGVVRLDDLQLRNPQLTVSATGGINGDARTIDLTARLANLGLLLPEFPGPVTVQGTAAEDGTGYRLNLSGTGPGQINAVVAGTLGPNLRRANLTVKGTAQAGLANPFLGNRVISGPVSVDLALDGPLALSSLSGRVSLAGGRLADPALPFTVQNLNANVALSGGQAQVDNSAEISTGGRVVARGTIGLTSPFNADLTIGVQSVTLRDPQLYETRTNGELSLTGPLTGGAQIAGRIALPETEIRVSSTGLGGATSLEGLTHINEPAPVRETRRRAGLLASQNTDTGGTSSRPFGLNIVISAPNRLFIRGRGLDAELGGELLIAGTSANVIPSGAFNLIRGRLDILGQRITLTRASLQLEGDFDPTLDVIASTEANGITSSVIVSGSASDPEVTFSSNPELPEEEVLAQLLFGRQLDQLSAFQALQLANAVATLAGRGGDGIISKLRQGTGLDDLDIQTDDAGNAQLKAGKYLSENLYSEVVVDQSGQTQINLNLDVTDSLTFKGRVGADGNTGIGLFFEKDY